MGVIAVVAYKPREGQQSRLMSLVTNHVPTLRSEGLVTGRQPIIMFAKDNTLVEVFEWSSPEAIDEAHHNPVVKLMWEEFAQVCDYVPISNTSEANQLFSEFTPLN